MQLVMLSTMLTLAAPRAAVESLVADGEQLEKLWSEGSFTEGPAYGPDHCVYFSDIGNRTLRFDPSTGRTMEYRNPSGRANGLDFDPKGRIYFTDPRYAVYENHAAATESVYRIDLDGQVTRIITAVQKPNGI